MQKKPTNIPYSKEHYQDIQDGAHALLQDLISKNPQNTPLSLSDVIHYKSDKFKKKDGPIDTIGADYFLLKGFITDDMYWDFDVILEDFLKHCLNNLSEFSKVAWYHNDELHLTLPDRFLMTKVMNLIFNGTKVGNEYCIELMKQLYMTYHKKEYKILKRFRKISASELISIAEDLDADDTMPSACGRILGMCTLFNIECSEDCSILYVVLENEYHSDQAAMEAEPWPLDYPQELFDESLAQVEQWLDDRLNSKQRAQKLKYTDTIHQFIQSCMHFWGIPDFYVNDWLENYMGTKMQFARTLSMLKLNFPNREWTWEELQQFTYLYSMAAALVHVCERMTENIGMLLQEEDPLWRSPDEIPLFKPEKIKLSTKATRLETVKPTPAKPIKNDNLTEADYLREIQELRQKLNSRERTLANLKELYQSEKHQASEYHKLMELYQQEHEELISLRNFAFHATEEFEEIDQDTYDKMKAAIAKKRIMLVGGHTNWLNKLKKEFPNWVYVPAEISTVCDGKLLENLDKLYFFTDHLSHSTYGKYVAMARERKIPFGYVSCVNLEMMVRGMWEDLR